MKTFNLNDNWNNDSDYSLDYKRIVDNLKINWNYFLVEWESVWNVTNDLIDFSMNQLTSINRNIIKDKLQIQFFSKQKWNWIVNDDNFSIVFCDNEPVIVITNFRDELNYSCIQSFQNIAFKSEKLSSQPQLMWFINNYFDKITNKFANKNWINNEYNTMYFRVEYNTLSLSDFANTPSDYSIYQLIFADLWIVGIVLVKNLEYGYLVNMFEFQ